MENVDSALAVARIEYYTGTYYYTYYVLYSTTGSKSSIHDCILDLLPVVLAY